MSACERCWTLSGGDAERYVQEAVKHNGHGYADGYRAGLEAAAKVDVVLSGYGDGYETSAKRVPYARGWSAGQKAMRAAIRALMTKEDGRGA